MFFQLEKETVANENYRQVVQTIEGMFQLVLMSLGPGEDIPEEEHEGVQFIRVEAGAVGVKLGGEIRFLEDGDSVTIPPYARHYVWNASRVEPAKLYSIYVPPEHAPDRVDRNQPKDE